MDVKNITSFFNKSGEKFVEMSERVGARVLAREAAIVFGTSMVGFMVSMPTVSTNPLLSLFTLLGGGAVFNTLALGAGLQYNREFERRMERTRRLDYNDFDHN